MGKTFEMGRKWPDRSIERLLGPTAQASQSKAKASEKAKLGMAMAAELSKMASAIKKKPSGKREKKFANKKPCANREKDLAKKKSLGKMDQNLAEKKPRLFSDCNATDTSVISR